MKCSLHTRIWNISLHKRCKRMWDSSSTPERKLGKTLGKMDPLRGRTTDPAGPVVGSIEGADAEAMGYRPGREPVVSLAPTM